MNNTHKIAIVVISVIIIILVLIVAIVFRKKPSPPGPTPPGPKPKPWPPVQCSDLDATKSCLTCPTSSSTIICKEENPSLCLSRGATVAPRESATKWNLMPLSDGSYHLCDSDSGECLIRDQDGTVKTVSISSDQPGARWTISGLEDAYLIASPREEGEPALLTAGTNDVVLSPQPEKNSLWKFVDCARNRRS